MAPTSLRERKRLETWRGLHEAARGLALVSDGLGAVTIDAIVERVNVSARTFFNYFDTKEDAILGFREPRVSDAELVAFTASTGPLLSRVADFYFEVLRSSRGGSQSTQRRLALIRRHPELASRQLAHFYQAEELVRNAVHAYLAATPLPAGFTAEALTETLLAASSAANRIAARAAVPAGGDDRAAMHHALAQLREVTRNIP